MNQDGDQEKTSRWRFGAEAVNNIVQTVAIIAAGAWAVYTFVYQAKIAPSQEPPTLSVTSTLEKAGHKGNQIAIRSTVTRSNVGQTGVRLLGLTYNLIGRRVRFIEGTTASTRFDRDLNETSIVTAARDYDDAQQEVIMRHGVLFEGATALPTRPSVLNPGETVSRDMIFYADRTQFDSIRFQVRMTYAKEEDPPVPLTLRIDEQGQLEAAPTSPCPADTEDCTEVTTTDFAAEMSLW